MATSMHFADFSKFLECAICTGIYNNPKRLVCNHQFCKECLDGMLEFNAEGAAVIRCPLGCEDLTIIGESETTNMLLASYDMKGMAEMMKSQDEAANIPTTMCCHSANCDSAVALYCCGLFLCRTCFTNHNGKQQQHEGKTDLVFDKGYKLRVLCSQHSTPCSHLCSDNTFLCVYCLHRTHADHVKLTIEEQADKIKESLINAKEKIQNMECMLKITEESIVVCEQNLNEVLRERKVVCLSRYLDFLDNEEQAIKDNFQILSQQHMQKYSITANVEYCHDNLQKSDIQLAIEKNAIIDELFKSNLRNLYIQPTTIVLSDDFGFADAHPLGELQINSTEATSLSHPATSTFNSTMVDALPLGELQIDFDEKISLPDPSTPTFNSTIGEVDNYESLLSNFSIQVRKLIKESEAGIDLNKRLKHLDEEGIDYVKRIIEKQENEDLRLLLHARGKIVDMRDGDDSTLLHYAGQQNKLEALKLLVGCGASVDVTSSGGHTVLRWAVWNGSVECVDWLTQHHPTLLNIKGAGGYTPLHCAAIGGHLTCTKILLERGADHRVINSGGQAALHAAVSGGHLPCVKLLLEHGVDIHAQTNEGSTPLHLAAIGGRVPILKLLLEHGANLHATNNNGDTPIQWAKQHNKHDCVKELQKHCSCKECKKVSSSASHSAGHRFGSIGRLSDFKYGY